ncbi:DASH complex subunit Dad2-domain-containing protein [Trichophaea hybrida]|nr:DASH complex subunit Dad2-domain-containing protein [Trichophaea hybrida]
MSGYQSRYSIAPPHNRQSSLSGGPPSLSASHQSPALVARIEEKKQELESLIALRDLSGNLASQMEQLEEKLSTLADGTEAVAAVLSNWQTVLRAISMASTAIPKPKKPAEDDPFTESVPKDENDGFPKNDEGLPMPQTLVRIPVPNQESKQ